jgi:hypothetical protein
MVTAGSHIGLLADKSGFPFFYKCGNPFPLIRCLEELAKEHRFSLKPFFHSKMHL